VKHWLMPFLAFDLVVTAIILMTVVKIRVTSFGVTLRNVTSIAGMDQLRALETFAREQHQHIGEYMRSNWSGVPEQLPPVISALLAELESTAKAQNLPLERDALKAMLASSLRAHRIGKGSERSEAFKQVA
jgi:hypothetical protein